MASVLGVDSLVSRFSWWRQERPPVEIVEPDPAPTQARQVDLASLVEGQIIPQLLTAHRDTVALPSVGAALVITPSETEAFATLPVALEANELLEHVERFLDRGVSPESIFLNLLAPSARKLGRLWEEDTCSFVDVTMGLWRLQEVMREVAWRSPAHPGSGSMKPSALFAGMPGEQHSFGTLMVNETFDRAGWRCDAVIEATRKELLERVEAQPFDLVGLTITCDSPSGDIKKLIQAIRSVSHNPQVRIMIGGRVVNDRPWLVEETGADGTASDAQSALSFAECLVNGTQRLAAIAD